MYLIEKGTELDLSMLGKILVEFQTTELPRLKKYHNYYMGKQAILYKQATDVGKPCNKIVANYCSGCVDTYSGYLTGIDINYDSEDDIQDILDVLNYNDCHTVDTDLLKDALIFGRSCEMMYVDEEGQTRFKVISPMECIPVYDDTVEQNLVSAIRFYKAPYVEDVQDTFYVEVYDENRRRKYRSSFGFAGFELIEEEQNFFNQCPITFMSLNKEEESIFAQIISLQDAYNDLLSGEVDDFLQFADAYLVMKGIQSDNEDLASMKEHRVLMIGENDNVEYLTKNINDTNIQNMLENINNQIHTVALYPDFNDEKFMAQSGIAMRYKLVGFENRASAIEANMRKALQRRIELIAGIIALKGGIEVWRDINIVFTRNLPQNTDETVNMANSLRGLVSDETLLSLLPFVANPADELARIKKQKQETMDMYSFPSGKVEEEDAVE